MSTSSPLERAIATADSSERFTFFWLQGKGVRKLATIIWAALVIYLYLGIPGITIKRYRSANSPGTILTPVGLWTAFDETGTICFVRGGLTRPSRWIFEKRTSDNR